MSFAVPEYLSVVVPVRNEQDNVESLIAEINSALKSIITHEIIYVDDGSTDGTNVKLQALKSRYPQLRVIRHKKAVARARRSELVLNMLNMIGLQHLMAMVKMIQPIFLS